MRPDSYRPPKVVDYGSLIDLTRTNGVTEDEDGVGKMINSDGSNSFVP